MQILVYTECQGGSRRENDRRERERVKRPGALVWSGVTWEGNLGRWSGLAGALARTQSEERKGCTGNFTGEGHQRERESLFCQAQTCTHLFLPSRHNGPPTKNLAHLHQNRYSSTGPSGQLRPTTTKLAHSPHSVHPAVVMNPSRVT